MKILSAPLQGFTEAPWRNNQNEIFGGIDEFYTPFMRIERNELRKKDIREISLENNCVPALIPQILASKPHDVERLVKYIAEIGYKKIDINLGCPFHPVANKKYGCGMLPYPDDLNNLIDILIPFANKIEFSIKSRLGWNNPNELLHVLDILKRINPSHLSIHPRIGTQQYEGDLNMQMFSEIYSISNIPLIYNGEIKTVDDAKSIIEAFPCIEGIMIGRGLLQNPALARMIKGGKNANFNEIIRLHDELFQHYSSTLNGDAHILSKMKPFWEYLLPELDRKIKKAIRKSSSIAKYQSAIASIPNQ